MVGDLTRRKQGGLLTSLLINIGCVVMSGLLFGVDLSRTGLETACFGLMAATSLAFGGSARRESLRVLLPSWGFLSLFWLNYPVQYVATAQLSTTTFGTQFLRLLTLRPVWGQEDLREQALRLMTMALCLLSLALTARLVWRSRLAAPTTGMIARLEIWCRNIERRAEEERRWAGLSLLISLCLIGLALPIQVRLGIGVLANTETIDHRLGGVLYHLLITFVPLLLLNAHLRATLCGSRLFAILALGSYIVLAAVEALMMSSRGYLAVRLVEICFLYFCVGRHWKRAVSWLAAGAVMAVLLYPLLTSIRESRSGQGLSVSESIGAAWQEKEMTDPIESALLAASRFIGFSSLLVSMAYGGDEFAWAELDPERIISLRESGFTRWFTERVAGYGAGVRGHFSAPGLMGAGWLLGGTVLAVLAPAVLGLFAQVLYERWTWLSQYLGPLAPVALLEVLLMFFNEGTIDISLTRMALTGSAIVALAMLFRGLASPRASHA